MNSRRRISPAYEGPLSAGYNQLESFLENKLAVQAVEIKRLVGDNHKLAATHVALRQDLVTAQQEIHNLKEHIRNVQTESDIQIRVLLDKIAKMESDLRGGETVKKDLQEAHVEARNLVAVRCELTSQKRQASHELANARDDIQKLPKMLVEIDSLREELQRLRKKFEYEKGLNTQKVEQMRIMEKDLVGMARVMERLRAEALNAERRGHAPNLCNGP